MKTPDGRMGEGGGVDSEREGEREIEAEGEREREMERGKEREREPTVFELSRRLT